ncbi:unnamed protein product [Durusdinium trenchii]|uniref:Poly [ADP-ribose] polymerase n=1 Tax=Durusdinium trenchii TaxID=1381693 RepID=A0ABP0IX95_9DINO
MAALPENPEVQKWGCMKLSLCGGHERAAAEAEAPRLIAAAMKQHEQNGQIQDWGSQAFAAFCAGADPESCSRKDGAVAEGAVEVLVKAAVSKKASAKRQAIGALGSLFRGEDVGCMQRAARLVEARVPQLLEQALKDDESSRTVRKVFGALAELVQVVPEQLSPEMLELVERALAANAGYEEIQRLGERIQQAAPQRECSKDKPTYWSGHIGDEGWAACPVTGETLSALRTMFVVNHPAELGRGRDADSYPRKYNDLRVHCAWRIEHEDGWDSFALERSKVQKTMKRLRQQGVPVQRWQSKLEEASKSLPGSTYLRETGERFLLHGCSPEVVLGILHSGFDDKVTKKGMFGAGCYFAEDPEKADQYARPDPHHKASGLEELHARLYNGENTHPEGDVFYCFAVRVVCGACVQTKGLDKSRPTKDALSGEEIFFNADLKQLVEIPGTTPPERYHTLVVNPTSESTGRSVYRNREVISFKGAMTYAEYLIAFTRELT